MFISFFDIYSLYMYKLVSVYATVTEIVFSQIIDTQKNHEQNTIFFVSLSVTALLFILSVCNK